MNLARRVVQRIDELAGCTDDPPRLTRLAYSPAMERTHDLVRGWMEDAGLTFRVDVVGNVVGRREGTRADARTLLMGSHLDTVRDAGRYDGAMGFLLTLACAEARRELPFALEVLGFIDEEGVRFQSTYLGSRAVAGAFGAADLQLKDADGCTLAEVLEKFGGAPERVALERRIGSSLIGYVEAHIEQGPVLEAEGRAVGVVSGIAGQTRARVTLVGEAGHAGTVPMRLRRDAACAAAEFILAVEGVGVGTTDLVATVGQCHVAPGASNVIPGVVELTLDVRHQDDSARIDAVARLNAIAHEIAERRRVECRWLVVQETASVTCDTGLSGLLRDAIGPGALWLTSGAGHDAAALASLCPVAMLFTRCRRGISHHPDEFASEADISATLDVLLRFLDRLALIHA